MAKSTDKTGAVKSIAAKCKSLETELSVLNRNIKNHPDNDKLYYSKAVALKKLAEITGNKEHYTESLEFFNKAIELNPEDSHYIIKRAELFIGMQQNQKALDDLQVATGLAKDILDKSLGDLSIGEMATVNTIIDVAKLNLQDTVEHKVEHTSKQDSLILVIHVPRDNEVTTPESLTQEATEEEAVEIVGATENYNICPYCGY